MQIIIKRRVDGPSIPELGTPVAITFDSVTVPLVRPSTGPAAISSYQVERATSASGPWTVAATGALIFGNPPVAYVDGGRLPLTTYYYRAKASDTAGRESAYSGVVSGTTPATVTGFNPPWPRLGAVPLNDQNYDQLSQRQHWSRFHIVCFTHYNGWQVGRSLNMAQVMQDMKSRAPASLGVTPIHVIYTVKDETYTTPDGATQRLNDKLNAENWWLRTSFPGGSIVPHEFPGNSVINDSSYCPNDASGRNWNAWKADLDITQNRTGEAAGGGSLGNSANAYVDGLSCDVVIYKPRWEGDYNRDGTSDSRNDATIQYALRLGQKQYFDRIEAQWPGSYRLANTDYGLIQGGALYSASFTPNPAALAPMNGVLQGTQMEYALSDASAPYSLEYQTRDPVNGLAGFYALRNSYNEWESAVQAPKLNIFFDHQAFRGDNPSAWQATRFGMACCWLLGDAYVYQQPDSFSSALTNWADEYDNGGNGQGWMGYPVTGTYGPSKQAYDKGVYRRDFTNAVVLLNPRNNGQQTISLPFQTQRILGRSGYSDTSVNNGAVIAAGAPITLRDRDALILRRA